MLLPFPYDTGKSSDDVVLDTVVFLGTCACDEACTMLLCKAEVITSLIELLKAKQEDDEMVLQIVFVFQQILRNESTRDYMIKETGWSSLNRKINCSVESIKRNCKIYRISSIFDRFDARQKSRNSKSLRLLP